MSDWKECLLAEILNCGYLDLQVLEDCEYDMSELIEECKFSFGVVNLNALACTMFVFGRRDIQSAIEERIAELEGGELTEAEEEELENLKLLDVWEDIESFHNFIDTSIWINNHKEIYENYLSEALAEFERNTGYVID